MKKPKCEICYDEANRIMCGKCADEMIKAAAGQYVELSKSVNEWCHKIEDAIEKGQTFDTFTQIFYDKFCASTGRENKR